MCSGLSTTPQVVRSGNDVSHDQNSKVERPRKTKFSGKPIKAYFQRMRSQSLTYSKL